jgi:hypothetical protein
MPGFDGEADAHQLRAHRVERIGFAVEGEGVGRAQSCDPFVQLLLGEEAFVAARRGELGIDRLRLGGGGAGIPGGGAAQAGTLARLCGCGGAFELAQRLLETVARIQGTQLVDVAPRAPGRWHRNPARRRS